MITLNDLTNAQGLAVREHNAQLEVRTAENGKREITGIGVPYGEVYETPYFRETFEAGAITDDSNALAFFEHRTVVGKVTAGRDVEAGREVTLTLSQTPTGDEALTLARDGVIRSMSIGFIPVKWREEHDDDHDVPLIVHEQVEVREYSLVPFPAYSGAAIASVRATEQHHSETPDKETTMTDTITRAEHEALATSVTERLDDIKRSMADWQTGPGSTGLEASAAEFRSIGEWVEAAVNEKHERHDLAMTLYRDVTTSDVPSKLVDKPGFIGDLTKKIAPRRRWINRFSTRPLPAKGMTVDYIKTLITAQVAEQEKELDALVKGTSFSVTEASAKVRTFGGAETVSRQTIDRYDSWALTGMFEAFAMAYARETEAATKTYISGLIDEILADGAEGTTVSVPTEFGAFDWIDAIVDSAGIFEDRGYDLQELAVSPDVFKKLAAETGLDGRPLLTVSGTGVNVVGTVDLPAGSGELMRVPVTVLHGTTGKGLFYDPVAIETLESPGAPFWLSADTPLNLARDYAAYGYVAHINPHPGALLPVNFSA